MKTYSFPTQKAYYKFLDANQTDYITDSGYDFDPNVLWYVTVIPNGLA